MALSEGSMHEEHPGRSMPSLSESVRGLGSQSLSSSADSDKETMGWEKEEDITTSGTQEQPVGLKFSLHV